MRDPTVCLGDLFFKIRGILKIRREPNRLQDEWSVQAGVEERVALGRPPWGPPYRTGQDGMGQDQTSPGRPEEGKSGRQVSAR